MINVFGYARIHSAGIMYSNIVPVHESRHALSLHQYMRAIQPEPRLLIDVALATARKNAIRASEASRS